MVSTELTKLVVVVLVVISGATLTAAHTIDPSAGIALIMTGAGYVFGNGHGVITAQRTIESKIDELARAGAVDRRGEG
jgi:hypothetical protein